MPAHLRLVPKNSQIFAMGNSAVTLARLVAAKPDKKGIEQLSLKI